MRHATLSFLRHSSFGAMYGANTQDDLESHRQVHRQRETGVGPIGKTPTRLSPHQCSHCGHIFHGPTKEHALGNFMDDVRIFF